MPNDLKLHIFLSLAQISLLPFSVLFLFVAAIKKNNQMFQILLVSIFISGIVTVACYYSGLSAENLIDGFPAIQNDIVDNHKFHSDILTILVIVLSFLSLIGLKFYSNKIFKLGFTILAFCVASYSIFNSLQGLNVRHTETRNIKQNFENN